MSVSAAGSVANLVITTWASSCQAELVEVSRLNVDLPRHGDLVLEVVICDFFVLLEENQGLKWHVKVPWCDSNLRQLVPVELVGLRHPHERVGVLDLATVMEHVLTRPLVDVHKGARMKSSPAARQ